MYHLYETRALVLEARPIGEANCFYTILTEEFGLVRASAQGVRLQKSKLAPHLQELSLSDVTLVRGKDVWRITNASRIEDYYAKLRFSSAAVQTYARIVNLLRRLVHGEERHEELFRLLVQGAEAFSDKTLSDEYVLEVEAVLVLKFLALLGYVRDGRDLKEIIESPYLSLELLHKFRPVKKKVFLEINRSLRASGL